MPEYVIVDRLTGGYLTTYNIPKDDKWVTNPSFGEAVVFEDLEHAQRTADKFNSWDKDSGDFAVQFVTERMLEDGQNKFKADYTLRKVFPGSKSEAVQYCEEHFPEMTKAFKELQESQYELLCKKQMDYGPGNIALGTRLSTVQEIKGSLMGIVIRANDKMQRLLNLIVIRQQEPTNESIEDSFMDLAVYSNIALIVKAGKWGK